MVNKSTGKGLLLFVYEGFHGGSDSKESACNEGDLGSIPGLGRSPGRKEWQPTPVFLPGVLQFMGSQRVRHD